MNKSESKYFNTAKKMNKALLSLLEQKDFDFITVKKICEKAGVNRSTFYLHYDNTADLLEETIENNNKEFLEYFGNNEESFISNINQKNIDELHLITPKYLIPYLTYIKDNKKLHLSGVLKNRYMKPHETFERMAKHIFYPILEKYGVDEKKREYILAFYTHAIIAVVEQWLKNDCNDSIEFICDIITDLTPRSKND